jgi:hypothetical protein
LVGLVACEDVPKDLPTDEERERLEEAIDVIELQAECIKDVATLVDPEILANEHSEDGSLEEFQKGVDDAVDTAITFYQEGRIFVYNPADTFNPGTSYVDGSGGFFGQDIEGDFIAVNRTLFSRGSALLPGVLIHEGAHKEVGHTDEVLALYDEQNEGENVWTGDFTEAAIASNDFPYQLSDLSFPGNVVRGNIDSMIQFAREYLEADAAGGDWESFSDRETLYTSEAIWRENSDLSHLTNIFDYSLRAACSEGGAMEAYGINPDRLVDIINESDLYRYERERFRTEIGEMVREFREKYDAPPEARMECLHGSARR